MPLCRKRFPGTSRRPQTEPTSAGAGWPYTRDGSSGKQRGRGLRSDRSAGSRRRFFAQGSPLPVNLGIRFADITHAEGISGASVTKPTPPSEHTPLGRRCAFCGLRPGLACAARRPRNLLRKESRARVVAGGFFCVLAPIIAIRPFPNECRAEAVRQRIIADQVRSSGPIVSIANDAGRAMPRAAFAPLTRAELGRRTFPRLQLISGCCIRKDADPTKGENRHEAKHG